MYTAQYNSPIGVLTLAATRDALCGLWICGQKYHGTTDGAARDTDNIALRRAMHWLDEYFAGRAPEINFNINPTGTVFQRRVWHELSLIPHGQTVTYGDIAHRIGCKSARAVGMAIGHNPISIIVPCHRVIGANGKLTGYAGGIKTKEKLLKLERGAMRAK